MQLCKSPEYPFKAARLTRISSMHELQHIAGDETLDVKILYVVRDQIFYLSVINFTFL